AACAKPVGASSAREAVRAYQVELGRGGQDQFGVVGDAAFPSTRCVLWKALDKLSRLKPPPAENVVAYCPN
ncbi:hypothetical protein N5C56_23970, partial [Pseudomonas chengduensis]